MKILQFPIVRICFWLILGIIAAYYCPLNINYVFGLLSISTIIFGYFLFQSYHKFEQKKAFSISLYFLFFAIGITTTLVHNDTFRANHYTHNTTNFESNHLITATVIEKLKNTTSNNRYIAEITRIDNKIASGKILLNLKKDSITKDFVIGTKLKIEEQLVRNFKPNNPNQFDYGKYLETKGIYAQLFAETSQLKISTHIDKNIWYYTSTFRNKIILNLEKSGFKKEELAVISALILGQQQDISPEVLRDYQYAGAVHILSVSGLHVGFILLFITFLLKPLPKNKYGNFIRLTIILISLWLFALVAGLAPSVVRSAAMFSFVSIGMFLNRETNIFHTMLVSLFLILLIEPLFLFDIGFQLSYIALFFILWLQPMLKSLWEPKNKIVTYFWDIITVSFAAQIGAMPLSIYYFHQFPGLFFVTNLVLIPCLSVIMAIGVLLMILAYFDFVPLFLSKIVELSITFTNTYIKWIASIETFVIKDIPLSFSLLIASYLLVFTWIIWFMKPNFTKIILAFSSVLIFQLLLVSTNWQSENKKELIVFNAKRNTIIGERIGKEITLCTNNTLTENGFEKKMIQSYVTANFCEINNPKPLTNTIYFNNNKILIIDKSSIYKNTMNPDIIILRDSPKVNLERLLSSTKPKIIIADASNYKSYITAWKQTCAKEKIPFHSTYEKGFYKL
ncbi:competence protein ComEC [Flavobacterium swingsii]|uniref:Competence protein ComEC n=1 Tax=Flavobacterium swingsii TaxID=498292 RepID=A0A1I0YCW4_9FLAO|nr:ComEC/Rec2 family competence protein [Flavobacterium swingsii]SFB11199.1 competence protein ComEC [Flavobacterium swingsii]